ncbi:MAG: restriction endonuclease [Shimia sp.]
MSERLFIVEDKALPSLPGMMLATVRALRHLGGSAHISELEETVAEREGVSEHEQSLVMSQTDGRFRLNYYLAWARTYLRRGGALENSSRGVWSLTTRGKLIDDVRETTAIYEQVSAEERERARRKREVARADSGGAGTKEASGASSDDTELDWEQTLLATLKAMEPSAFERLSQRLLRENGFTKVEVRGKSGDGGIDGVGVLRVNLVSFQVFFQCKRYKGSVGASEIRDFRGAMQGRADKGLFITTGTFTAQASEEATRDGATAIDRHRRRAVVCPSQGEPAGCVDGMGGGCIRSPRLVRRPMIPLLLTFLVPAAIALVTGLRGYRDRPRTLAETGWGLLWAILFATAFVFAWHVAWLAAAGGVLGSTDGLVGGAVLLTLRSGAIWFPLLVISYVFNAQRGLRA